MLSPQDITAIKGLIDERLDWLGQILKSKFDSIDERFDAIDDRFDLLESKIDLKLDTEVAYGMFGSHDRRISKFEDDGLLFKRKLGV